MLTSRIDLFTAHWLSGELRLHLFTENVQGAGCARPRLKRLATGPLLLTGGRVCVENITGLYLWLNQDGMGGKPRRVGAPVAEVGAASAGWSRHSISAAHNDLWRGDAQYLFTGAVNDSAKWETLAYTSILPTGTGKTWPLLCSTFRESCIQ
jgi:hypothetical protein